MSELKTNKMGTMPIDKLIINMSFPIIVSMMVQAMYNIVDSIFVAQLGENALTSVTIAFPLQSLVISVGVGTGVGASAILSRSLGEKNYKRVNKTSITALFLSLLNSIIFAILGFLFSKPFIMTQTDNKDIISFGTVYLTLVTTLSIGVFFQITFERLLQATGRTMLSMITQLTGAVLNIILDPIMIFGLFNFPKMGVKGAALATIIGQFAGCFMGLYLNQKYNKEINLSFKEFFHPDIFIIKKIYFIGIPSILMMSIGSLMTYFMNKILMKFSSTAIAVFGVYFKLQSFIFMPVFGLNNGLIPILSYNYGAKNKERIDKALKFSIKIAISFMLLGTIIFETCPKALLNIFNASDHMITLGIDALRIIALYFPLVAIGITLDSTYQAFGKSYYSLIISLGRQLFVLIPSAYLLSLTNNVTNVWWSFVIAEVFSLTLSIIFFRKLYREDVIPLDD